MFGIERRAVPEDALLARYVGDRGYADCYTTTINARVTHAQFVAAFYTTWAFRLERLVLRWWVSRPSTDAEARALASGDADTFAAWRVAGRRNDEILLADFTGRTRSWLKSMPLAGISTGGVPGRPRTRLFFGSAVIPRPHPVTARPSPGGKFNALLGFHRLYSRILLRAACRRTTSPDLR